MHDFREFNFFVGANNSGKSAVLSFISSRLPFPDKRRGQPGGAPIEPLERHGGSVTVLPKVAFGETVAEVSARLSAELREQGHFRKNDLLAVLTELADETGYIWVESSINLSTEFSIRNVPSDESLGRLFPQPASWSRLMTALTGRTGGGQNSWTKYVLEAINYQIVSGISLPPTRIIPAIRQIDAAEPESEDYSGSGLIQRLAKIQNPDFDKRDDYEKFVKINEFLKSVTDRADASIEIPNTRTHILVHMDDKVLPLSSLGTGIAEVVMLAAFCTLSENEIICIEEPEIHLHPLLQRKLVNYLRINTSNQYFIATHSASFIDTPGAAVFHVRSDGKQTTISEAQLQRERHAICMDLGHRASDIVQANAVIWVEGPSDRIYLKHWIRAVDADLREGIHYSIMFYGGRLLSHLSADDEDIEEFIGLRALNRHLAIIMDSDKASAYAKLNATKLRIKREFEEGESVAWVTKGREVENYIDHGELQDAVRHVVGSAYASPVPAGQFDHALHFNRSNPKKTRKKAASTTLLEKEVDKVKVARRVVEGSANLDVLDLKMQVGKIVDMIRRANV